jgi:hypothetical protein
MSIKEKKLHNKNNLQLCIRYLPKLRFAGQRLIQDNNGRLDNLWSLKGNITTRELLRLKKPCTLSLQEVTVSSIPKGIKLPNLTSLHLFSPSINFCCDSRMLKVTELGIYDVTRVYCIQILNQIGQQLKILRLELVDKVNIDVVLRACPNLKHLAIAGKTTYLNIATQVELDTVRQLNVLEIVIRYNGTDPGVLLQLLRAPELRKLALVCRFPPLEYAAEIVCSLQQHKILQKLEHVYLEDAFGYEAFSNLLLNSLTLHCPNLINVSGAAFRCNRSLSILESCWDAGNAF